MSTHVRTTGTTPTDSLVPRLLSAKNGKQLSRFSRKGVWERDYPTDARQVWGFPGKVPTWPGALLIGTRNFARVEDDYRLSELLAAVRVTSAEVARGSQSDGFGEFIGLQS